MKIYLDMDGVLADFEKRFTELYGPRPTNKSEKVAHFYKFWDHFVQSRQFETLDWNPGAEDLLKAVVNLSEDRLVEYEILSSSSSEEDEERHSFITEQKTKWLKNRNIQCPINIVKSGLLKSEFAMPWDVLIDDTEYVVQEYRRAGGFAILHTDFKSTLNQLLRHYDDYITYRRHLKLRD